MMPNKTFRLKTAAIVARLNVHDPAMATWEILTYEANDASTSTQQGDVELPGHPNRFIFGCSVSHDFNHLISEALIERIHIATGGKLKPHGGLRLPGYWCDDPSTLLAAQLMTIERLQLGSFSLGRHKWMNACTVRESAPPSPHPLAAVYQIVSELSFPSSFALSAFCSPLV